MWITLKKKTVGNEWANKERKKKNQNKNKKKRSKKQKQKSKNNKRFTSCPPLFKRHIYKQFRKKKKRKQKKEKNNSIYLAGSKLHARVIFNRFEIVSSIWLQTGTDGEAPFREFMEYRIHHHCHGSQVHLNLK